MNMDAAKPLLAHRLRSRAALTLLGLFLLGCLTGGAITALVAVRLARTTIGGPAALLEARLRLVALDFSLHLSRAQHEAAKVVLEKGSRERFAIRQRSRPEYNDIRDRERAGLRPLLRPDQLRKFDQSMASWDESVRQEEKAPP
jgi:hypothetical protein